MEEVHAQGPELHKGKQKECFARFFGHAEQDPAAARLGPEWLAAVLNTQGRMTEVLAQAPNAEDHAKEGREWVATLQELKNDADEVLGLLAQVNPNAPFPLPLRREGNSFYLSDDPIADARDWALVSFDTLTPDQMDAILQAANWHLRTRTQLRALARALEEELAWRNAVTEEAAGEHPNKKTLATLQDYGKATAACRWENFEELRKAAS